MEELFKDLSIEQLEEVREKYPKYAEKVQEEIDKRNQATLELEEKLKKAIALEEAETALQTKVIKELDKVFKDGFPFTNLLITREEVETEVGEPIEVEIDGRKEMRTPKEMVDTFIIRKNIYWKSNPITSGTTSSENKGTRNITVSKIENGNIVETFWFDNAELASKYYGIPKDAGSAVKRLKDYDKDGIQFLVSNGVKDGILHKEVDTES